MRKSGLFFFGLAAIILSLVIWGQSIPQMLAGFNPAASIELPAESAPSILDLTVDAEQLLNHVYAIAQPRYDPEQKAIARQYITAQLASYGVTTISQSYGLAETGSALEGANLIAEIPGSDSAAGAIVLGAHYDTISNSAGADDNGSAIAVLIEAARIFSAGPSTATLKLVFFDQEEQQTDGSGLLGSLAYTKSANATDIKGAVILDMVGYACRDAGCQRYPPRLPVQTLPQTGDFLAVLGLSTHTNLIGAFVLSAQKHWPLVLSLPIPERTLSLFPDLLRSDHAPFWDKNIPAVFVTDTANFRNPNYHTPRDLPVTLDASFLAGSAQHIVNAIAMLLNQLPPPPP
ncbi:MAG: peptidase M28 [Leptolyngbya foveolarum]|uniref:Peptidase M28 n=1 Tax=Leptolyngbya foveolarum TaxID=47253 RepID=A0A2W4UJB3_9CYAN|nr:MAG: peptidase M28 [Leptolyngbya foveolarum]